MVPGIRDVPRPQPVQQPDHEPVPEHPRQQRGEARNTTHVVWWSR